MTRKRTTKREAERAKKNLDVARLKLALLSEGYSAEKPIRVVFASQIEPHARGMTCPVDDVGFQVIEHVARPTDRVVTVECKQCGRRFRLHFAITRAN